MKRVLILAHREELIFQAVGHARNAGLTAGIEMGNHRAHNEEVVVSTVQTQIAKRKCRACKGEKCDACEYRGSVRRMEHFNPHHFGLVIIDEAHHSTAKSYRLVMEWFKQNPDLKILMVTATPRRADGIGMHNVCDSVAYEMDLRTAIDDGWLCPIRQRFVTVEGLDLSNVKTKAGGDLADGELEKAFLGDTDEDEEYMLHSIAKPCLEEAKGQPLLVFASGVAHAEKLTAAFNAYDGVTAELVIGTTDKEERKRIIDRYKRADTQVLCGCGVFTEGFDAPGTAVVAVARPTKSESLYLQMIGRGTRPLAGIVDGLDTAEDRRNAIAHSLKPNCVILDFIGNSGNHKLISVADVLAGEDVDPIDLEAALAEAKELDSPQDMEELLEKAKEAREQREAKAEEERKRRLTTRRKADEARYTATDVDLFDGKSFDPFTDYDPPPDGATQKQVAYAIALGHPIDHAVNMTKRQARGIIDRLRNKSGPEYRVSFGKFKGKALAECPSQYLTYMLTNGYGPPDFHAAIREMRSESHAVAGGTP